MFNFGKYSDEDLFYMWAAYIAGDMEDDDDYVKEEEYNAGDEEYIPDEDLPF